MGDLPVEEAESRPRLTDTKRGRLKVIIGAVAFVLAALWLYGWWGTRLADQDARALEDRLRDAFVDTSFDEVNSAAISGISDENRELDGLLGESGSLPYAFGLASDGHYRGGWKLERWGADRCVVVDWSPEAVQFAIRGESCHLDL